MSFVSYPKTNENISSIVSGLDIQPHDKIVAIGGSGDQAFAILEYVGHVLAVDEDCLQVDYIDDQLDLIAVRDYETFWSMRESKEYFLPSRLDVIRRKLDCIEVRKGDIVDVCRNIRGYNKVYLSNSLYGHPDELAPKLVLVSSNLPIGGLVYASNGGTAAEALVGTGLVIDFELTRRIIEDNWHPVVLRKESGPSELTDPLYLL
jgi:hypothetical protein